MIESTDAFPKCTICSIQRSHSFEPHKGYVEWEKSYNFLPFVSWNPVFRTCFCQFQTFLQLFLYPSFLSSFVMNFCPTLIPLPPSETSPPPHLKSLTSEAVIPIRPSPSTCVHSVENSLRNPKLSSIILTS